MDQRYRRVTIHWSTHTQEEQDETKNHSYGVDWRWKKGMWYCSAKLDNRLSPNVQDIRRSHKVYQKYHGKLESRTDSRRKKFNWSKSPEKDLQGRFAITITICNSDDAIQSLKKCTGGYRLHKSQEKINHLMYMAGIRLFAKKWERTGNPKTGSKNIIMI